MEVDNVNDINNETHENGNDLEYSSIECENGFHGTKQIDDHKMQLELRDKELETTKKTVEKMKDRIKEVESNESKLKMYAVKIKKTLDITKEELTRCQSNENQLREQLKTSNKENEKISSTLQQNMKNFQTLQSEYDRLQDVFDQLKNESKTSKNDLSSALSELVKTKDELAELKLKHNSILEKNSKLLSTISEQKKKNQEQESIIIVIKNELAEEKKKALDGLGLEKSVEELKNQLIIKTNEVIDLEEEIEKLKKSKENLEILTKENEELKEKNKSLMNECKMMKDNTSQIEEKTEDLNTKLEGEKIKISELTCENNSLKSQIKLIEDQYFKKFKSMETLIRQLQESLTLSDNELKKKETEFSSYKIRVCKLLNEKKDISLNNDKIKELEEKIDLLEKEVIEKSEEINRLKELQNKLENELKNITKERNELSEEVKQIDNLAEDNLKMKSLVRDLQKRLVKVREDSSKESETKENEWIEKTNLLKNEIDTLKDKISLLEKELSANNSEKNQSLPSLPSKDLTNKLIDENSSNYGDLESIDSAPSYKTHIKKSSSSSSILRYSPENLNPLHEILNPRKELIAKEESEKIQRITELLQESESSNVLLGEQNRVLKDEIRRLQRSIERVDVVNNMEYLKNILVKFVASNTERKHLVPVLKTILKLNNQEENVFNEFAKSTNCVQDDDKHSVVVSNWSSYLWNFN